jgi:hypothetical protein
MYSLNNLCGTPTHPKGLGGNNGQTLQGNPHNPVTQYSKVSDMLLETRSSSRGSEFGGGMKPQQRMGQGQGFNAFGQKGYMPAMQPQYSSGPSNENFMGGGGMEMFSQANGNYSQQAVNFSQARAAPDPMQRRSESKPVLLGLCC